MIISENEFFFRYPKLVKINQYINAEFLFTYNMYMILYLHISFQNSLKCVFPSSSNYIVYYIGLGHK